MKATVPVATGDERIQSAVGTRTVTAVVSEGQSKPELYKEVDLPLLQGGLLSHYTSLLLYQKPTWIHYDITTLRKPDSIRHNWSIPTIISTYAYAIIGDQDLFVCIRSVRK